jgi:hypothetical protein
MKIRRSLLLVATGLLGASLLLSPLAYAAEGTSGRTTTVESRQATTTQKGETKKMRQKHQAQGKHHTKTATGTKAGAKGTSHASHS